MGLTKGANARRAEVEKSKTVDVPVNDFSNPKSKPMTHEDVSSPIGQTEQAQEKPTKPEEETKLASEEPLPADGKAHNLNSLVTQVKQGQMFPEASKKKVDLDKELEKVHTPRGGETERRLREAAIGAGYGGSDQWKNYYVTPLLEHLANPEEILPGIGKLYREHFYQTAQSVLFLQNVEKIDDNLLVEKKVYLPPNFQNLDETLVHCNETIDVPHDHKIKIKFANGDEVETGINIRPYAIEFLKEMSKIYEVMIFTASHSCYANVVLNILDPNNEYIIYRLFRDQCLQTNEGIFIKDLRIIANRSLENMLIVDNATYSFGFQLENGIPIVPFYDNPKDTELLSLMEYLKRLAGEPDVRTVNYPMFMYELIGHYCSDYEKLVDIVCGQNNSSS